MRSDVVDDRPDDPGVDGLAVPSRECVQVVLACEHVGHRPVGVEQPDTTDTPIAAACSEVVAVDGEVGAMEAADADVHERGPVVAGDVGAAFGEYAERLGREPKRVQGILHLRAILHL